MLDRLIDHILTVDAEALVRIAIQDAAICRVWHKSWAGDASRLAECEGVPAAVENWAKSAYLEQINTEGRRHQWILRELIDELLAKRVRSLTWDQIELLLTVHDLAGKVRNTEIFDRVRSLILPYLPELTVLSSSLSISPGMAAIASRLHVVKSDDITRARPREVKLFAGIPLHVRGPLLVHEKGHLKILDQVPENCTVVVEDGSVSVDGFVLGRIAASQHCEVRDNISGMVIVRQGNIRARGLMVKSFVVSKWGSVYCRQAEAPNLVFAGTGISIDGNCTMGIYKSPDIKVKDDVNGGVFHVSRNITAARFKHSDSRPLSIVLQPDLTCQDYGEDPGPDGIRLLNKANRMKRQLNGLGERITMTQTEAEHAARSAVAFLLGGESASPVVERLHRAQHRLALINRVTSVFQTLIGMAEERVDRLSRFEGKIMGDEDDVAKDSNSSLNDVHAEFSQLESEGDPERDISEEMQEAALIKERLLAPTADLPKVAQSLEHMRARMRVWQAEREQIQQLIAKQESGVQVLQGANERVKQIQTATPMVQFLRQLITLLRERGDSANSPQMLRLNSGFMRVVMRAINTRIERVERDKKQLELSKTSLHEVAERLRKEYQIAFEDDLQVEHEPPRATGRFNYGVTLYADAYLIGGTGPTRGAVIKTEESGDTIQSYERDDGLIAQVD